MHRLPRDLSSPTSPTSVVGSAGLLTLLAALFACGACSSSPTPGAKTADKAAPATSEKAAAAATPQEPESIKAAPVVCVSKEKMVSLLAKGPLPPAPTSMRSAVASLSGGSGAKGDSSIADAYKKVAPATVIVKTDSGMGSGIIIDPAGWVLTNYHVVDGAKTEDFKLKATVEVGKMTAQGRMERVETVYEAFVHKADPVRDLAILKIVNPPKDLPSVKVAKKDIEIGSPVLSVGNAGIGFLWAAKGCQVSAVGEKSKDLAALVAFDCKKKEGNSADDERAATQCDERKQLIHDMINSQQQGLVIQTDCSITHGDSGGPLVNTAGELVGLNQSIKFDKATASFHVHGAEIREFLSKIPAKPAQLAPDPWCDGGLDTSIEDVDLDGQIDTLYVKGYNESGSLDRMALLLDLDQDQFGKKGASAKGNKKELGEDAAFDAEAIILVRSDGAYIWYDSNNDGKLDLLLVDTEREGSPAAAWNIAADGSLTKDADKVGGFDLRPELFSDEGMKARFGRIASVIRPLGWMSFGSLLRATKEPQVPDAIWGGGRKGELRDIDGDGKPDTVRLSSMFSSGYLIDADEDTLGSHELSENPQALINERGVDAELSIISQGQSLWAMYDTNNDGKFDLALFSPPADAWGLAMSAWTIGADGKTTPSPEFIGRSLIRPGLIQHAGSANRLYKAASRLPFAVAANEGAGSMPDPYRVGRNFDVRDIKGFSKAVLQSGQAGSSVVLVDIDQGSLRSASAGASLDLMVRAGGFKADMAHLHHNGLEWAYYDTDQDGKFDFFLFTASPRDGKSQRAFRLDASGKLAPDAGVSDGPLIRWSVFTNKQTSSQFKKLAKEVWSERAVEP